LVAQLVLIMLCAALVGSGVWALSYVAIGAIPGFEEAATGTIIFGWTTALIVAAAHNLYFRRLNAGSDPVA